MSTVFLLLAAATIPIRNPFWPVGYRGKAEPISDEPRIQVATEQTTASDDDAKTSVNAETIAAAAAEQDVDEEQMMSRRWIAARKSLKIGGTMKSSGDAQRQSIAINGRIYGDGDYISANHDGWRFTWRVKKLTENKTLQLVRVRARDLDLEETQGTKEPQRTKGK